MSLSGATKIADGATEYASAKSLPCPVEAATLTVQWQAQLTSASRPRSNVW